MKIQENIAGYLKQAMQDQGKSMTEFSKGLDVPLASLKNYMKAASNLRADTIELLAKKCHITPAELISGAPSGWKEAKAALCVANEAAHLTREQQAQVIHHFLALVDLFSCPENGTEP